MPSPQQRPARPVLGIVCCNRDVGEETAQAVMNRYIVSALPYADAAALLIPSRPDLMSAREVAPRLDGLLLTGSPSNVEPHRYGPAVEDAAGPFDPERDQMTADLIEAMLDLKKPVFGICRGFQEVVVNFGGALRRDVAENPALLAHHAPGDISIAEMFEHEHDVLLEPGGVLQRNLGRERLRVISVHYQGAERIGAGLKIEARAPDGVVEAVSAQVNGAPVVAVQWHPEWDVKTNAMSQRFFHMLGRALRGQDLWAAQQEQ